MSVLSNLVARMVGDVGPKQYANGSNNVEVQLSRQGAITNSPAGGKYAQIALSGRLYSACSQAKIATTAALATTYTGFALGNPITSGKNAIIHEVGWALTIASDAAGSIGLMVGLIGTTTMAADVVGYNCLLGGPAASCVVDNGTTIGTPILNRVVGSYGTLATTGFATVGPQIYDAGGSLVITPGYFVAIQTTAATTATFEFHMVWEEVPV